MPELTPRAMAYRLRRMQRAVQDRVAKEEERVARQALRRAQDLSGGRFSTADLARGGWHPFAAQRYSAPQLDPAIINEQSGAFRRDWVMLRQPDGSWSIENHNPVAEFLQPGTRMMFRRPIDDAVRDWWERERYNRVMAVLHRIGL